jgi:hypothetical protein
MSQVFGSPFNVVAYSVASREKGKKKRDISVLPIHREMLCSGRHSDRLTLLTPHLPTSLWRTTT